jgi:rod shape-determining protein MreC
MAVAENPSKLLLWSFLFFAISLALSAYSARNPWVAQIGVNLVGEVLRPLEFVVKGSSENVTGVWSNYVWLVDVRHENERIKERVEALEAENSRLLEGENELKRLRKLVNAAEDRQIEGIAAEVIGYDPSNWVRAVTVDKGSLVGIAAGMPVIEGDAVVGQVIAVSPNTARVLLLTDHSSAVDALVQSSRARGVVHGLGKEYCELRYVLQEDEVAVGDRIVTSGMDGIFPKGLTVGVVAEAQKSGAGMFQRVRVDPAADIARLESVLIVTEGVTASELPAVSEKGAPLATSSGILRIRAQGGSASSVAASTSEKSLASASSKSAALAAGSASRSASSPRASKSSSRTAGSVSSASSRATSFSSASAASAERGGAE